MSFLTCVNNAVNAGLIDQTRAGRVLKLYRKMEAEQIKAGAPNPQQAAAQQTAQQSKDTAAEAARRMFLQARAQKKAVDQIRAYVRVNGMKDIKEAVMAIFDNLSIQGTDPGMDQIRQSLIAEAHSRFAAVLQKNRVGLTGSSKEGISSADIVKELFGKSTGNKEARAAAKAWNETSAWLRAEYNKAGGRIAWRDDWGLPQSHDWLAIANVPKDDWVTFIKPLLDLNRMSYGGPPLKNVDKILGDVYDTLSTNGAMDSKIDSVGMVKKPQHSKRVESRFLVFKDPEGWLKYQEQFGKPDPFQVMIEHINKMARDIGAMRRLGPNPEMGILALKLAAEQEFAKMKSQNSANASIQAVWDYYTGASNIPESHKFAKGAANVRALLVGAQLGSAVISATSDISFVSMTAHFNGMSATKVILRAASLVSGESREQAVRLGFIAEGWTDVVASQARYHEEALSSPVMQKVSGGVLRASGLPQWTDTWRWAFQMEMLAFFTDNVGRKFDDLPPALRKTFDRYNLSASDWDKIRVTPLYDAGGGAKFLRPQDIARRADLKHLGEELSTKLYTVMHNETSFAVPTASLRAKALLGRLPEPGTVLGEAARSGLMYKNFPITIMMTHMRRGMDEWQANDNFLDKASYASTALIWTTLAGGLALQLKQIKDGKEPSDMTMASFWARAMTQGGGLGIFGDFILKDHTRYGAGPAESFAGPPVGAAGDVMRMGQHVLELDPFGAAGVLSNYVPGRSLWFIAGPYKQAFQARLNAMSSDNPERKYKRTIKNRQKQENAGYWWEPGSTFPEVFK